jgi:hypothetical protein
MFGNVVGSVLKNIFLFYFKTIIYIDYFCVFILKINKKYFKIKNIFKNN